MMRRLVFSVLLLCACAAQQEEAAKDADPAIAAIQERIAQDTANWQAHADLANELRRKNRLEEAAQAAEQAFQLAPSPAIEARLTMAKVYAAVEGRSAAAINLVKEAEKQKRAGQPVDEVRIAEVYAVLGDTSAVFRWLDRGASGGSPNMATLSTNPEFVGFTKDPRWHY
jgi:tetratricopeptide (TPR) repeat protein